MKSKIILLFLMAAFASTAQTNPQRVVGESNPGVSFALSAILPGAGEMYNHQVGLGLGIFGTEVVLFTAGSVLQNSDYTDGTNSLGKIFVIAGGVIYAAQLVYAPIYSQHLNNKNGFTVSVKNNGLGLAYRF